MNKRDNLYAKLKQNRSNPNLKEKFKVLKYIIQKKLRESYNTYIESIITDQQETSEPKRPNKRFYTFIRQQKSDSKEIHVNCLISNGIAVGSPFMINSRFWLSAGNGLIFLVEILDMNINNKSATSIFFSLQHLLY